MNSANFHKHGLPLIQEPDLGYYVTHCKLVLQSKHDIIKLYLSGICLSFILMKESPNYELRTRAGRSEQNPIVVQAKTGLQITKSLQGKKKAQNYWKQSCPRTLIKLAQGSSEK